MPKPELEFFAADERPWVPVPGAPPGHFEKVLTQDPDRMFVTRLLKAEPGSASTETFVHDFWEEVLIVEGSQWDVGLGRLLTKGMYACRPPGMKHGPYRTEEGCVTFEVRYQR
jgi:ChrR-like protein with cupin domain